MGFEFGSLNGDVVTSDEVRTWLYEADWRRASLLSPGCVAVREWREFDDAEDVVDMRDDAESLPLTLVCGVGRVGEGKSRGEADITNTGGNTECVVYCRYRMGFANNTGAGAIEQIAEESKKHRPNSDTACVTRKPVLREITKNE